MTTLRPRHAVLTAAIAWSQILTAQQAPQPAERAAEFLPISFAAVGADGNPALDLTAADIFVKIDGKARPLRSLQVVSVAGAAGIPAMPPPFGSNAVSARGRRIALFVDDESFPAGGEAALRAGVGQLLEAVLPADRVMLLAIPHGGISVAPTSDHGRIRTALAQLVGRGDARLSGSALACRTRTTLEALSRHLQSLSSEDAPTIVALITAGLAPPRRDAPMTVAPGMCELPLELFREVGVSAGRARAQFYIVPPVDIMSTGTIQRENIAGRGGEGSDNPVEGIEQLLGVTGGRLLNVGAAERSAFARIAAESSAYYVAAIEPQRGDRGRAHALNVSTGRRGVEVRASRSITFTDRPARTTAPSPREMLSTMTEFRDLPLRAAAYPSFEEPDGRIRVLAIAEPIEPDAKFSALSAALFGRDGKAAGGWVAQPADLDRAFVIGAIVAPPGAYRLRVAAIDATGRSGTADYEVDVDLARTGPLKVSAILLGLSRGGAFVPKLQFQNEPVAIGYLEMTGAAAGARVTAMLELSDTANGPALLSVPLTIEANAAGRFVARGPIAIGGIPPGDYAVRAMVALEGHPMTRVVRTLRKVVPAAR